MELRNLENESLESAAVLLLALNEDNAGKVLKHLSESDIYKISNQIANMQDIEINKILDILSYFADKVSNASLLGGHLPKLKRFLHKVFDEEKVDFIIKNVDGPLNKTWETIANMSDKVLVEYLKNEYPQTVAFILSKLPSQKASKIISKFSENFSFEVIKRILNIDEVNKNVSMSLENILKRDLVEKSDPSKELDNNQIVADIFNNFDRKNENIYFDLLEKYDAEKAQLVRKYMLIFDDIMRVDSRGMQMLIRYSDKSLLPKALKFASDDIKNCFFDNMSARAAKILIEEIDNSNNIKAEESERAQKNILLTLRELMNKDQITLRDIIKNSN